MPSPFGSALVTFEITNRWALSLLTESWSDEDKQALLDGDREAHDALWDAAVQRSLGEPQDIDRVVFQINIRDGDASEQKATRHVA